MTIKLQNTTRSPLVVYTGLIVGAEYPLANFSFLLQQSNGQTIKLYCGRCGPVGVAGKVDDLTLWLAPGESHTFAMDLSRLSYFLRNGQLVVIRTAATHGARILVTLQSRPTANHVEQNAPSLLGDFTGSVLLP